MDVPNLLSQQDIHQTCESQVNNNRRDQSHGHQYPTRQSMSANTSFDQSYAGSPTNQFFDRNRSSVSYNIPPATPPPKYVTFELHLDGASAYRARLPMRVQIFPHDTTDSIVTTVKNFYGLYEGTAKGVSFEDRQGNTLIARYENFSDNMVVYVRVIPDFTQRFDFQAQMPYGVPSKIPQLDEIPQMLPPQPAQILHYGQPPSRPASRISRKQSASPKSGRGRRSASAQKNRSRSGLKSRGTSFQAGVDELNSDTVNGYSSSDGGAGSVTSSRKAKSEQLASAEISIDNIVAGNRRKRAKFESSELPLFVPAQVPAPHSISSISPQRRSNYQENPSPFPRPTQKSFSYNQPIQSPQSYGYNESGSGLPSQNGTPFAVPAVNQHGHSLRNRSGGSYFSSRSTSGTLPRPQALGILPTPDPTIASCISDEDVALQLMRLGDASNISHGRTSASTLDDAFSGRADAASSVTSESEDESDTIEQVSLPPAHLLGNPSLAESPSFNPLKKQRKGVEELPPSFDSTEPSGDEADGDYSYEDKKEDVLKSDPDERNEGDIQNIKPKLSRSKSIRSGTRKGSVSLKSKSAKAPVIVHSKKAKQPSLSLGTQSPMSPASLPSQSRKTSSASTINFQHQLGVDEDDLSSKPRCQRCRKSKKGCDRQRPCQRCKDAGIGIDGCVSEDEGNGRKGRYGRHMGVPVKKGNEGYVDNDSQAAGAILTGMAGGQGNAEKSKKRKR